MDILVQSAIGGFTVVKPYQVWKGELGWCFYLPNWHPLGNDAIGPFDTKAEAMAKAAEIENLNA